MKINIYTKLKNQLKTYKISTIVIMLMITALACEKKGDAIIPPSINDFDYSSSAFSTPESVLLKVNGLYSLAKSGQVFGGRYFVYNDIRGEDFLNVTSNPATAYDIWRRTLSSSSSETNDFWEASYKTINNINAFIEGIERNAKLVDASLATKYKAEARFLRALHYYALVNTYGQQYIRDDGQNLGVILKLVVENYNSDDFMQNRRSSVGEVYDQIIADLNFAEQNLPSIYATFTLNNTRAHKNSAIALKTRIYLTMGKWADVIQEANKIVSANTPFKAPTGVANTLQTSIADVFAPPYRSTESMFSFSMGENIIDLPGKNNGLASFYMPSLIGNGDFYLNPTGILASPAFVSTDTRYSNFVKKDFAGDQNRYRLTKFPTGPEHTDHIPVIRYAEVLLNLAEAKARLAGTSVDASALTLLNAVRGRSTTAYATNSFATGKDLVNAILTERRIELLGEGFRSIDIQRNLLPFPARGNIAAIPITASAYIWPMPSRELGVNKFLVPNP